MSRQKICLASDNCTSAHPSVIQSVLEANESWAAAYGADPWTQEASHLIQQAFRTDGKVIFVPTGTGANVLALKLICRSYESVIGTDIAHMYLQETGAAEAIVGCKLLAAPHRNGKITPEAVTRILQAERALGKHSTLPRVLSLTQPTEVGTVYTLEELQALSLLCLRENLCLHIDGSRLYNAAVCLGLPLHELFHEVHVDVLSLGGTKNGLMNVEALVVFNPSLQQGCDHLQKQTLQLSSKMRYLSAQYLSLFRNDLWCTLAKQANEKARQIAAVIEAYPSLSLSYPVETNQVFFTAPASWLSQIQEEVFCYLWNSEKNEIRLIASWNTSEQDVKYLAEVFEGL